VAKVSSTEKDGTRTRAVDLDVAIRAISVLRIQVVLRACWFVRAYAVGDAVASQAQLCNAARRQ
jgi:hypothetical protein